VVLHWQQGDGIAADPPSYTWRGERLNAGWVTTFNEYAIVSENRVTAIPDDLDLAIATLFGCAITTGLGVVSNDAAVKLGESVVVFGAGGVGLSIVQGAALAGAHPIVAIDLHAEKLELAEKLGATHLIDSTQTDPRAAVAEIVGDGGADVIVDNTGNTGVIQTAYEMTASAGRTILVGVPPAGNETSLYTLPLHFGKVLRGSHGGAAYPPADIPRYLKLAGAGKLDLEALVTDRYELDQINEAIADLRGGRIAGRCVLAVSPEGSP
jgi:S-(hydroxymethyl)glutathione dehydrogenase/alcohol dehydrogenase